MIIPDAILEKMDPADRAKLPKRVRLTTSERERQSERLLEREMHNQFSNWLTLRKHVFSFVHADPSKPSRIRKGWPDYTVLHNKVGKSWACLIEFKTPTGRLSQSQIECFGELSIGGHQIFICDSVGDAIDQILEYFEIAREELTNE